MSAVVIGTSPRCPLLCPRWWYAQWVANMFSLKNIRAWLQVWGGCWESWAPTSSLASLCGTILSTCRPVAVTFSVSLIPSALSIGVIHFRTYSPMPSVIYSDHSYGTFNEPNVGLSNETTAQLGYRPCPGGALKNTGADEGWRCEKQGIGIKSQVT